MKFFELSLVVACCMVAYPHGSFLSFREGSCHADEAKTMVLDIMGDGEWNAEFGVGCGKIIEMDVVELATFC
jgi:hypothetical protein